MAQFIVIWKFERLDPAHEVDNIDYYSGASHQEVAAKFKDRLRKLNGKGMVQYTIYQVEGEGHYGQIDTRN